MTAPAGDRNPHHRGGTVLFEVPFASAMEDRELALLARVLDLWTHSHPQVSPDPNSLGVARLDRHSGLFLERGASEGRWILQARSWGSPAPRTVHDWHVLAAQAARQLDPRVALPGRLAAVGPAAAGRPVAGAAARRSARAERRLAGLP